MKLCFSTLGCAEKKWDEILSLARKYGIGGLEIRGVGGELDNAKIEEFKKENATKTIESARACGLSLVTLGTSCMFHNPASYEAALTEGKNSILIAERLAIPYIRVFGNNLVGEREACICAVASGFSS